MITHALNNVYNNFIITFSFIVPNKLHVINSWKFIRGSTMNSLNDNIESALSPSSKLYKM